MRHERSAKSPLAKVANSLSHKQAACPGMGQAAFLL